MNGDPSMRWFLGGTSRRLNYQCGSFLHCCDLEWVGGQFVTVSAFPMRPDNLIDLSRRELGSPIQQRVGEDTFSASTGRSVFTG